MHGLDARPTAWANKGRSARLTGPTVSRTRPNPPCIWWETVGLERFGSTIELQAVRLALAAQARFAELSHTRGRNTASNWAWESASKPATPPSVGSALKAATTTAPWGRSQTSPSPQHARSHRPDSDRPTRIRSRRQSRRNNTPRQSHPQRVRPADPRLRGPGTPLTPDSRARHRACKRTTRSYRVSAATWHDSGRLPLCRCGRALVPLAILCDHDRRPVVGHAAADRHRGSAGRG